MYVYIHITKYVDLCSVPREVVPGGAMSVYSDDILDVDPTLHRRTAAKKKTHTDDNPAVQKQNKNVSFCGCAHPGFDDGGPWVQYPLHLS